MTFIIVILTITNAQLGSSESLFWQLSLISFAALQFPQFYLHAVFLVV